MGLGCGVGRLLLDPTISRDPGIFSKSRSRDSKKSNHGIFGISKSPSTKRLYSKAFNPFHWPYQLVLRPLIAARGSKITFQAIDFSATNIQHELLVTGLVMQERTYLFTKHLLLIYFKSPWPIWPIWPNLWAEKEIMREPVLFLVKFQANPISKNPGIPRFCKIPSRKSQDWKFLIPLEPGCGHTWSLSQPSKPLVA